MTLFIPSTSISSFPARWPSIGMPCVGSRGRPRVDHGLRCWKARARQRNRVQKILLWATPLGVALYGFGRSFTEHIRLDYSYDTFGPIRFKETAVTLICVIGIALFALLTQLRPGLEVVAQF